MSCGYVGSNNNRFYVGMEETYGAFGDVAGYRRIPAVSLRARRVTQSPVRHDKTGTRTFVGLPSALRAETNYELNTYLTGWADQQREPVYGALFAAGLSGASRRFAGGHVAAVDGVRITLTAAHGLTPGQAIACNGEVRFVNNIQDAQTVLINAPFSAGVRAGAELGPTHSYWPGSGCMKSIGILDCWSPAGAVQRMVSGAAVDRIQMEVNGDFHQFRFSGPAADLFDNSSFQTGDAGLQQFPQEPSEAGFDYSIVPGHLGEAWIGSAPTRVFTLASARVTVDNNVDLRAREFGYAGPRAISAGRREVRLDFTMYAQTDDDSKALCQAARQRSPMSVMLQLGQQDRQLCGVFMRSVVAETPEFDDGEPRLMWSFQNCSAQGSGDDEIVVAFA